MNKPNKIPGTNKFAIDPEQVEKLAIRFWTNVEIASFFGVNEGTIRKRFSDIITKGRQVGKGKLRDLQLRAAERGNAALLIWLGKQYLNQTENGLYSESELFDQELSLNIPNDSASVEKYKLFIS